MMVKAIQFLSRAIVVICLPPYLYKKEIRFIQFNFKKISDRQYAL